MTVAAVSTSDHRPWSFIASQCGRQTGSVICRIWHGYTTDANADAYQRIVRTLVIPDIEQRAIPGFIAIDLVRRQLEHEVEFMTIMWFDSEDAIVSFVGPDATVSHVPPAARAVLARFDERSQHCHVLDRRTQSSAGLGRP